MIYLRAFEVYWEKEKDRGFTETGWIWAAAARSGRGLAAGRHWAGPVARPHARMGHVGGSFLEIRLRVREAVTAEAVST